MNIILARWLCCAVVYLGLFSPSLMKTFEMKGLTGFAGLNLSKWFQKGQQFTLVDTPTPIVLCSASDDLMDVTGVKLFPDPPQKGSNLTVTISGKLSEDLTSGAYLMAKVRKGGIRFPQVRFPACDYIEGGCPVTRDVENIVMKFDIPKFVPGGAYEIEAILYNKNVELRNVYFSRFVKALGVEDDSVKNVEDGKRVVCVQGSVEL